MAELNSARLFQRGGIRLDRHRQTMQLNKAQCELLLNAAFRASHVGTPFNRFITLLWERAGVDGRDTVKVTGHFIKLAGHWARRHGYKLAWAWVQEWGVVNGAHVHLLLHVPENLDWHFRLMPMRWAKHCLGGRYVRGTLDSKRVRAGWFGWSYYEALFRRVHYMLKCAPHELEEQLGMSGKGAERWGKSGLTYGKRLAVWQTRGNSHPWLVPIPNPSHNENLIGQVIKGTTGDNGDPNAS